MSEIYNPFNYKLQNIYYKLLLLLTKIQLRITILIYNGLPIDSFD